jgi:Pyridoxamine 5'-phosphate oxidase
MITSMPSWSDFEAAAPELAARVRERLDAHRHKTIATIRADGAPRISGIEAQVEDGELWIGSDRDALKARDLLRDPRFAAFRVRRPARRPPPRVQLGRRRQARRHRRRGAAPRSPPLPPRHPRGVDRPCRRRQARHRGLDPRPRRAAHHAVRERLRRISAGRTRFEAAAAEGRDSNPRWTVRPTTVFEAGAKAP